MDSSNEAAVPVKRCVDCGEEKPLTREFYYWRNTPKPGFKGACRACIKKRGNKGGTRAYRKTPEGKAKRREYENKYHQLPEVRERRREYMKAYHKTHPRAVAITVKLPNSKPAPVRPEPRPLLQTEQAIKQRQYYQDRKEERSEKAREERRQNPEIERERKHRYYQRHREKVIARARAWQAENPEKKREYRHRREARKRALPVNWTDQHWLICLGYWNYCCAVCGNQLRDLFGQVAPNADHWIPLNRPDACPGTVPENMICLCPSCNFSKHDHLPANWLTTIYSKKKAAEILNRVSVYFEYMKGQVSS